MAWTTPSTASVGGAVTAALWNSDVRDNLNAESPDGPDWISYTSTIGNGWTLGTGTISAKYIRRGSLIGVVIEFTVGNGTKAAAIPTFTLPVNAKTGTLATAPAWLTDIGVDDWMGQAYINTAALGNGALGFQTFIEDSASIKARSVTSTVPFTWGTNDRMRMTSPIFYEAA
jgi:hypothetical protein